MKSEDNLTLPVNTHWGGLLESGRLNWDYREVKPYWVSRICTCPPTTTNKVVIEKSIRQFKTVTFANRYTGHKVSFEVKGLVVVEGSEYEFFQSGKLYFIIMLGEKLTINDI